jgi:hypothetical protein
VLAQDQMYPKRELGEVPTSSLHKGQPRTENARTRAIGYGHRDNDRHHGHAHDYHCCCSWWDDQEEAGWASTVRSSFIGTLDISYARGLITEDKISGFDEFNCLFCCGLGRVS